MGGGVKKEYRLLKQKPVLVFSIHPFFALENVKKIVLTVPQGEIPYVEKLLSPYFNMNLISIIEGGSTRQESVSMGLKELKKQNPDYVLIHDGARPWISEDLIRQVMKATEKVGAALPVIPLKDALKEINAKGYIKNHKNRSSFRGAQTPQGFIYKNILEAHLQAQKDDFHALDDCELYSRYCGDVITIDGDVENIKITYAKDLLTCDGFKL
ncbi:MAG: 2-C-methyl-D-erythritol 4-phosphate cytidylyltransferase [Spirochaetales bacterium]|nr:2-C-methyl-D-erythritol 4-phosphate cytidylyltransferase [Spirochaetales bacterium]